MNKLFKHFRNQLGFSLAEVMIAAGIASGISLAIMKMVEVTNKQVARSSSGQEIVAIVDHITNILRDRTSCRITATSASATLPDNGNSNAITEIRQSTNAAGTASVLRYTTSTAGNPPANKYGTVLLSGIVFRDVPPPASTTVRNAVLRLTFTLPKGALTGGQSTTSVKNIPMKIVRSGGTGTAITDCHTDTAAIMQQVCTSLGGTMDGTNCTNLNVQGSNHTFAGNLSATGGTITGGTVNSNGAMTASGNITSSSGNISATSGTITGRNLVSNENITATNGTYGEIRGRRLLANQDVRAEGGDVYASANVQANGSVVATTGNIVALNGANGIIHGRIVRLNGSGTNKDKSDWYAFTCGAGHALNSITEHTGDKNCVPYPDCKFETNNCSEANCLPGYQRIAHAADGSLSTGCPGHCGACSGKNCSATWCSNCCGGTKFVAYCCKR